MFFSRATRVELMAHDIFHPTNERRCVLHGFKTHYQNGFALAAGESDEGSIAEPMR